jgi:hypothetical protein
MKSKPIELHQPGLLDAIKDIEAMGLWECLRRARRPITAAELAATGTTVRQLKITAADLIDPTFVPRLAHDDAPV